MERWVEEVFGIIMIEFDFKLGSAFLKPKVGYRRPITLESKDRENVCCSPIANSKNIQVICPDGNSMTGYIYFGRNNAGEYEYGQIEIRGHENDPLAQLHIGEIIKVRIYENENKIELVKR